MRSVEELTRHSEHAYWDGLTFFGGSSLESPEKLLKHEILSKSEEVLFVLFASDVLAPASSSPFRAPSSTIQPTLVVCRQRATIGRINFVVNGPYNWLPMRQDPGYFSYWSLLSLCSSLSFSFVRLGAARFRRQALIIILSLACEKIVIAKSTIVSVSNNRVHYVPGTVRSPRSRWM